jgi:hypothetical protein
MAGCQQCVDLFLFDVRMHNLWLTVLLTSCIVYVDGGSPGNSGNENRWPRFWDGMRL